MADTSAVEVSLRDSVGRAVATLEIASLPKTDASSARSPAINVLDSAADGLAPIQLREATEYSFELRDFDDDQRLTISPSELFDLDGEHAVRGRLRTGNRVGLVRLEVLAASTSVGSGTIEICAEKLSHATEYRWMVGSIAETAAELTLERFAPTLGTLSPDTRSSADADTLYQRFAFVQGLVMREDFAAAMAHIHSSPHREWSVQAERRRLPLGVPPSSGLSRQIAAPGRRVALPEGSAVASVPEELDITRHEDTTDTTPNQFVRHALEYWRELASQVHDALEGARQTNAGQRGLRETKQVMDLLDQWLQSEPVRSAGRLVQFPTNDLVLQRRAAYRDVFRTFLLTEIAAKIDWSGSDDVFSGGRRDVATLYELWAFLQLAETLADICGRDVIDLRRLLSTSGDQLSLNLRRGRRLSLAGSTRRLGRDLSVELWFNRSFRRADDESWTRDMRPDYSIRIAVEGEDSFLETPRCVWVHFDAKYKVDSITDLFGVDENETDPAVGAKPSDLLKMHAYRDGISGSGGAYVLYPGNQEEAMREYGEILPGLGAFPLRPTSSGPAAGVGPLRDFLTQVIDHVADQASQHERADYWISKSYSTPGSPPRPAVQFLQSPPADTRVTLGYVRSPAHYDWILESRLYNLRADGRRGSVGLDGDALSGRVLLLYGRGAGSQRIFLVNGPPRLLAAEQLADIGYPRPRGRIYLCLPITPIGDAERPRIVTPSSVEGLARSLLGTQRPGRPLTCRWTDVFANSHQSRPAPDRAAN